jgi:hypothetical protein
VRKTILIFLVTLLPTLLLGQVRYSEDPNAFIKEVEKALKATKREDCKLIAKDFVAVWQASPLVQANHAEIVKTTNIMMDRKMRIYPHLAHFYQTIITVSRGEFKPETYKQWHQTLDQLLPSQKRGSHKYYEYYMAFSLDFFTNKNLYSSKAFEWKPITEDYSFKFDSIPLLVIPKLNLKGITRGDTIIIYETSGEYRPLSFTWKGEGGMINWKRAGLDSLDTYCTFSDYSMVLRESIFNIPNVTFYYKSILTEPLTGTLTDKLVANYKPDITSYPRFNSDSKLVTLKEIAEGVDYKGGLALHGYKILGKGTKEEPATLSFYKSQDSIAIQAMAREILFKRNEQISSMDAEVVIYLDEDSIYHPSLKLRYNVPQKLLSLLRGDQGISATSFSSSFHNMEIKAEALYWKMDEPTVDIKMITSPDKNATTVRSVNYFQAAELQQWQGIADYNPVHEMKRYCEKNDTRQIWAIDFAEWLGLRSVGEIEILLFRLVEAGYIYYDKEAKDITVRDKTFNDVFANAEMIDFDVINFSSIHKEKNGELNLYNYDLNLQGVYSVNLSDSQQVMFFPYKRAMTVLKNRDMIFAGTLFAGRMDLYGDGFTFNYDNFKMNLAKIDSFIVNIPGKGKDKFGKPLLVPINTPIMGLTGSLYIDAPDNKSGKKDMPEYPILESEEVSYAYYHKYITQKGAYKKESFYYEIEPFRIEALDNFELDVLEFAGKLVSAKIFPDIVQELKVRPDDLSLGFIHLTPKEGLPAYGGRGTFTDTLDLSNRGLIGSGRLKYLASESLSDHMIFLPDTMKAFSKAFRVQKQTIAGTKYPNAHNSGVQNIWVPYEDVMFVNMVETPFDMYDGISKLSGGLEVRPGGLVGVGDLEWEQATLTSQKIDFSSEHFDSDTSKLTIKAIDSEEIVFSADNINSHVDFEDRLQTFFRSAAIHFCFHSSPPGLTKVCGKECSIRPDQIRDRCGRRGLYRRR